MKVDTTTVLLGVVAVAAIYLITRPKITVPTTPVYNPYQYPGAYGNPAGSTTAQDISASTSGAANIIDSLSSLWS